jgi:hypothetical protein
MQAADVVRRRVGKHAEHDVGARAHGERRAAVGEAIDEIRVGLAAHALFDAIDEEEIERLAHVIGAAFLAGVCHRAPAVVVAREREGLLRNFEGGCPTSGPPSPSPSN